MKNFIRMFNDADGNFSSTRVMFIFLIVNAIAMGWFSIVTIGVSSAIAIIGSVSSLAMGMKLGQNYQENTKNGKN